jgi:hypothetical protein
LGGRGSLSSSGFAYTDANAIKRALDENGIKLIGRITNRNKAVVSEIVNSLVDINKDFNIKVDVLKVTGKELIPSTALLMHGTIGGTKTVLVIPRNTLARGYKGVKKDITNAHKEGKVVSKNIKEAVMHEIGHEAQFRYKRKFESSYSKMVAELRDLQKKEGAKFNVSRYATAKASLDKKTGKYGSMTDVISESLVHILKGSNSRGGQDAVKIVKKYFEGKGILSHIPSAPTKKPRGGAVKVATKIVTPPKKSRAEWDKEMASKFSSKVKKTATPKVKAVKPKKVKKAVTPKIKKVTEQKVKVNRLPKPIVANKKPIVKSKPSITEGQYLKAIAEYNKGLKK